MANMKTRYERQGLLADRLQDDDDELVWCDGCGHNVVMVEQTDDVGGAYRVCPICGAEDWSG
jgi:rubrerythrin